MGASRFRMTIVGLPGNEGHIDERDLPHTDTNAIPIQKGTEELDVIPFVDEAPAAIAEPVLTAQPARDSADEAFGPVSRRPSVVDRELGLDRMNMKRQGKYACPC